MKPTAQPKAAVFKEVRFQGMVELQKQKGPDSQSGPKQLVLDAACAFNLNFADDVVKHQSAVSSDCGGRGTRTLVAD